MAASIKIRFVHNETGDSKTFWMKSSYATLWQAAYYTIPMVDGFFIGTGYTATLLAVTSEEVAERVMTVKEVRAALEADLNAGFSSP